MPSTFTPPVAPAYPLNKQTDVRALIAPYGDGYTQRVADGINYIVEKITLQWDNLSIANADTIENFIRPLLKITYFNYTLPGEGSAKKFVCQEMTRRKNSYGNDAINLTLEQVFDP